MKLPYLVEIVAKTNAIGSLDFMSESPDALKFLQKVDLSTNKITVLPHIQCANLYKLILDENEIAKSELKSHQNLKELSLKKNKLTTCEGIERMYSLHTLNLEENEIASLKGLSVLPKLTALNLKTNKLEKLDEFPRLEMLETLELDANLMATGAELPKLAETRTLKALSMAGNPWVDEKGDDFKKELLFALGEHLPLLRVINGEEPEAESWAELQQAVKDLKEERRIAAEEAAKAAEEAAKNPPPADGEAPAEDAE